MLSMISVGLNKAFKDLPRGLLIAKRSAYGVNFSSCKCLASYLYNRHKRVQLGDLRREWNTVTNGVRQGSIWDFIVQCIHNCYVFS